MGRILLASVLLFQGCAALPETGTYGVRAQIHKAVEVPLVSFDGVPLIQAHVNGAGPFWFVVDTGAEMDTVHSRLADQLQLQKLRRAWLNETVEGDWCKGIDLNIGGARYRPEPKGLSYDELCDGLIGSGFLRNFHVIIDYSRKQLWLKAPE